MHTHTGFADELTHVSESNARVGVLTVSICAVLLSEACNIGLEPLIKHQVPALKRHRLSWVKQNYLRAETLTNARLVDYQPTLPLAKEWGGGEVASADGVRFVTPVSTLNADPNRKFFFQPGDHSVQLHLGSILWFSWHLGSCHQCLCTLEYNIYEGLTGSSARTRHRDKRRR
nr:Tn3 family transposase [Vibrio tetraodonis]